VSNQSGSPSTGTDGGTVAFTLDGVEVTVVDDRLSLLDALRRLGATSVKDGCSPQGQCGCCTVLVDGAARVACVTPLRRIAGRDIRTFAGLDDAVRGEWTTAFVDHGASQCGFCSPGIIVRLESLRAKTAASDGSLREGAIDRALAAHLCRCTGWQTIHEAAVDVLGRDRAPSGDGSSGDVPPDAATAATARVAARDLEAAGRRATIELGSPQRVGPEVAAGAVGFSADTAPDDAQVAVPDGDGGWVVAESVVAARRAMGKVQGRRTTVEPVPPLDVPEGDWAVTLRTGWVDAAYVETDSSWCTPGGDPSPAAANGGAFGAKRTSPLPSTARSLAERHGAAVLAVWSREDCCREAAKRPPIAAGIRSDGSGTINVVRTEGIVDRIRAVLPDVEVVELDVAGPPTSVSLRGAGWAEAVVLAAAAGVGSDVVTVRPSSDGDGESVVVRTDEGAVAEVSVDGEEITVRVSAGEVLDAVTLRSYCIGAAHMALGWVTSEGLAVDADGAVLDLTVRSLGVLPASAMPHVAVEIVPSDGPAVRVSDAVFAAVAAAEWRRRGCPQDWPTGAR